MDEKFRIVWVTEPGKDFTSAAEAGDKIVFICNGYEHGEDRTLNIQDALAKFNPETDAWIPVGRTLPVAEIGLMLGRLYPDQQIIVGIYKEGEYTWERL